MSKNLPNLQPGDLVAGRFRIVEAIGSGGFSVVYRAHQEDVNRFIALKVLKPQASNDEKIVERFRREALYASHLSHPNTITLYDYGNTDGNLCYIAMEYLKGSDLGAVVQTHKPMDLKRVWRIMVESCRSLSEAHRLGLVHRDLKPENIFLVQLSNGGESIKVLDFGVSKAISNFGGAPSTLAPLTQEGTVFGTPLYMAPEQAMAEEISPAVDVYALGHIMFEMITGYAAYEGTNNAMDVMLKQINDPPLALPEPWGQTPFSELITLCTQKDPIHRIQDAAKVLEYLLSDAFLHWADPLMNRRTTTVPRISAVEDVITGHLSIPEIETTYPDELRQLNATFEDVIGGKSKMVVIEGFPGTGRSNLLRGFIDQRMRFKPHATILHRNFDSELDVTGLEYELSMLSGIPLQGKGITEVRRILRILYGDESDLEKNDIESDSQPIGSLSSIRDSLFSQIGTPFRQLATQRPIIWALENLERLDTLTLAFLKRFFRELQQQSLPIMIVTTVFSDALQKRPGIVKYTQALLQPGPAIHVMTMLSSTDLITEPQYVEEPATIRLDISFEDSLTGQVQVGADPESPFDVVLGHLAQLGNEIPNALWKLSSARILETRYMSIIDAIMEQAEKFGIISIVNEVIRFTQPGYAEMLRDAFEKLGGSVASHLQIAELLEQFYSEPSQEQILFIVRQWELGGQPNIAIARLIRAGDTAFQSFDLDSAREFFLQVQQTIGRNPKRMNADYDQSQLWMRLGEVHWTLAEYGAAEDALQKSLQYAKVNDQTIFGKANKLLGDLYHTQNKDKKAIRFYEKARDGFRQLGLANAFANTTNAMSMCALALGQTSLAEDLCRQALELTEKLGEKLLLARVQRNLGMILMRRARFREAVEYLDFGLQIFEAHQRIDESIDVLQKIGNAAFAAGDFDRSIGYFRHGMNLAKDKFSQSYQSQIGAAKVLAARESLDEAESLLVHAKEYIQSINDIVKQTEINLLLGDLKLAKNDVNSARLLYENAIELSESIGQFQMTVYAHIRVAYTHYFFENEKEIFKSLNKAMEISKGMDNLDNEMQVRTHLIYLQLLLFGFQNRADTFESLLSKSSENKWYGSLALCYIFKADTEAARAMWTSASEFLRYARIGAAKIENYSSFLQIDRRIKLITCISKEQQLTCNGKGFSIGALIPPEVGKRRFNKFPEVE